MITPVEAARRAEQLGVAVDRIHKDHVVSHVIAALEGEPVRFFGGTALARSVLEGHRLSEDIDFMAADFDDGIEHRLRVALARPVGIVDVRTGLRRSWMRESTVGASRIDPVRVQFVRFETRDEAWGWAPREIRLFYSCLPHHVTLITPTLEGFVAMKFGAFLDRRAPRDLFDLAELATRGAVTRHALAICRSMLGAEPHPSDFRNVRRSTAEAWEVELGTMTRNLVPADRALERVRRSLEAVQST